MSLCICALYRYWDGCKYVSQYYWIFWKHITTFLLRWSYCPIRPVAHLVVVCGRCWVFCDKLRAQRCKSLLVSCTVLSVGMQARKPSKNTLKLIKTFPTCDDEVLPVDISRMSIAHVSSENLSVIKISSWFPFTVHGNCRWMSMATKLARPLPKQL